MNQVREKKLPFLIFCAIVLFLPFLGKGGVLASAIIAAALVGAPLFLSLIHISEPTRPFTLSRMPTSA